MGIFDKLKKAKPLHPKLHKFTKNIAGQSLAIYCTPDLSQQAEFLLQLLSEEQKTVNLLTNGYKIQIGWLIYTILEKDDGFILNAPDFTKNPLGDITEDLSTAHTIQILQNNTLKQAGSEGLAVSFNDTMIILQDALNSKDLYFVRQNTTNKGDSGWYLGLLQDHKANERTQEDYALAYTYQLLKIKPQLVKLLSLPVGTMAIIKNDEIVEVVDNNNNLIL